MIWKRFGEDWEMKTEQPGIGKTRRDYVTKRMFKRICLFAARCFL